MNRTSAVRRAVIAATTVAAGTAILAGTALLANPAGASVAPASKVSSDGNDISCQQSFVGQAGCVATWFGGTGPFTIRWSTTPAVLGKARVDQVAQRTTFTFACAAASGYDVSVSITDSTGVTSIHGFFLPCMSPTDPPRPPQLPL